MKGMEKLQNCIGYENSQVPIELAHTTVYVHTHLSSQSTSKRAKANNRGYHPTPLMHRPLNTPSIPALHSNSFRCSIQTVAGSIIEGNDSFHFHIVPYHPEPIKGKARHSFGSFPKCSQQTHVFFLLPSQKDSPYQRRDERYRDQKR